MNPLERVLKAQDALLNNSGRLEYFQSRGLVETVIRDARIGLDRGAFTYPCFSNDGNLLGIHYKSSDRAENKKRKQWWDEYADDLPRKGHGKKPHDPAKIIPFGMETLKGHNPGSTVILCCGEEDALSLRQIGLTALSQAGAGLLEPVYARELVGYEVVVFYDAGEETEARKDALKLREAGIESVRMVEWSPQEPHGSDINGKLVEDPEGFAAWATDMIHESIYESKPPTKPVVSSPVRGGKPDVYRTHVVESYRPEADSNILYGLSGETVTAIEPHTEADPIAVLANLLVAFGNAVGRGAYIEVAPDRHHLNLDVVLVGGTAVGRKGMSWGPIKKLMDEADPEWADERVSTGLSTGEGLIHAVRNRVESHNDNGEPTVVDEGVEDKRILIMEREFAKALKNTSRRGNNLSPIVREAWDGTKLQTLTRNNPMKATNAHVSIIGHITKTELLRHLTETETANGFANRFIWLMVKRSKLLPFGGKWDTGIATLAERLRSALQFGKNVGKIEWGETGKEPWASVYPSLTEGKPGLFGAVVARAEAQTLRLAATYAVMDCSHTIERPHVEAALALWNYAEESARYIFGDKVGDPIADKIVEALQAKQTEGMTRTQIRDLFQRHQKEERIDQALQLLLRIGRVRYEYEPTGGRNAERWFLAR